MTEEQQAELLARWLADPQAPAPEGLDPEVVEGVVALAPQRGPALRVTADEILAEVRTGPLSNVVPLRPTWSRWVRAAGGASGVGLILAAAATLVLVVRGPAPSPAPTWAEEELAQAPAAAVGSSAAPADRAPAAPRPQAEPIPEAAQPVAAPPDARPAAPSPAAAPRLSSSVLDKQAEAPPAAAPPAAAPPPVVEAASSERLPAQGAMPALDASNEELSADAVYADDGYAQQKAAAGEAALAGGATTGPPPLELQSNNAVPTLSKPEKRRSGKEDRSMVSAPSSDASTAYRDANAVTEAEALASEGRWSEAAARLSDAVVPPAVTGQVHAANAARWYLLAGQAAAAEGVARLGLQLGGEGTPQRSALWMVLAEALAAQGDPVGAEAARAAAAGG